MKKVIIFSILTFISSYTFAQKDVAAKAILNKLSEKYKLYDVVKTDFDFTLENPQAGVKETQAAPCWRGQKPISLLLLYLARVNQRSRKLHSKSSAMAKPSGLT